jgi:nucleoside-diphosphate-sugar epimerase
MQPVAQQERGAIAGRVAIVTGAGGFIGHHLTKRLKAEGFRVVGIDRKPPEFEPTAADDFHHLDLRGEWSRFAPLFHGAHHVYHLAADMGGMGYIHSQPARIFKNNMRIDLNVLEAARHAGAQRFFYPSSACVYPESRTSAPHSPPLEEAFAYPAMPADSYGWEKLMGERLCRYFREDFGLETRVARFHTMYGPLGTWQGGREKFPAAICRKVILAAEGSDIEVWGDGEQTRTFCYVDDCLEGIRRLVESDFPGPVNIGSAELLSVNQAAQMVIRISGKRGLGLRHVPGPQGLRGRAPDNTLCRQMLGWEPAIPAAKGFEKTYRWIEAQVQAAALAPSEARAGGSRTGE